MALALQLIIIPVAVVLGIILLRIGETFSAGAMVGGVVIFSVIIAVAYGLLRFARRADVESGVDQAPDQAPPDENYEDNNTVATRPLSDDYDAMLKGDIVEECGDDSFPASDPPGWTSGPAQHSPPLPTEFKES